MQGNDTARFAAERLTDLALALAFGKDELIEAVIKRWVYLLTGEEEYNDTAHLQLMLAQYSAGESDIALLRGLAEVLETLENVRLDDNQKSGA
jgi:hypothetical protein